MLFTEIIETLSYAPTPLMKKAASVVDSLPLSNLNNYGFRKDPLKYSFVFQYPPSSALVPIDANTIWSRTPSGIYRNTRRKMGLYIHIPYCTGTCLYCYFSRYPQQQAPVKVSEYIDLIKNEIALIITHPNMKHNLITTIAFGGGTPTCLSDDQINDIFTYIREHLHIPAGIEISVESSPETITGRYRHKLRTLQAHQVNRLSIGIQAFEDDILKTIGRRHSATMAEESVFAARKIGFSNINLDIIYGLPGQSLCHWEHTLNAINRLRPESVSAYRIRFYPDGPLSQIGQDRFPQESETLLMYIMLVERLREIGYFQIASHKFVLAEEFIQKHVTEKQGIEELELLGIGVSAYSYINHHFYWNNFSLPVYQDLLGENQLPVWIGTYLPLEERMRKAMVLGMHEYKGVKITDFKERFGQSPCEAFGAVLDALFELGLLLIDDGHIRPSYTGMIFADEICTQFYSDSVKEQIQAKSTHRYGIDFIGKGGISQ